MIIAALVLGAAFSSAAQGSVPPRTHTACRDALEASGTDCFKTGGGWMPFPAYSDREGWKELMGDKARAYIERAEKYLNYRFKVIPATAYLELERSGSRKAMENISFANDEALEALFLGELAEGRGRFVDQLFDAVFLQTEQTSWVWSAHLKSTQLSKRAIPDARDEFIDLGVQSNGARLALVWHFFKDEFDKIDPSLSEALYRAMRRHIFDTYLDPAKDRENWWIGITTDRRLNNWTPWSNSGVVLSYLLMCRDDDELRAAIRRSAESVDRWLDWTKDDGACDEGPAYWNAAAAEYFRYAMVLNRASGGAFNVFTDPKMRASGEYMSRVFIGDGWAVNFGDGSARSAGSYSVLWMYGDAVGSDEMRNYAVYLGNSGPGDFGTFPVRTKDLYFTLESLARESAYKDACEKALDEAGGDAGKMCRNLRKDVPASTWYSETQHFVLHSPEGWVFASKGGTNNESHNHNDVGTVTLFHDGIPVFVDAGVGVYTRQTFSSERYKIWTMQSLWHNLPAINGIAQRQGGKYRADSAGPVGKNGFRVSIAPAYPESAACLKWVRTVNVRGGVSILDEYALSERKASDTENFLVSGEVFLPGSEIAGRILKKGEAAIVSRSFDRQREETFLVSFPGSMEASVEVMETDDRKLGEVWGKSLRRLSLTGPADAPEKGKYEIKISLL